MQQLRSKNPTIEYLRQALRADARIEALMERSGRLYDKATRATSTIRAERISGTVARSNVELGVVEMLDLADEIVAEAKALTAKIKKIERVIGAVKDQRHRDLLRWRYLNGWTWERITERMGRDNVSWTHKLHGEALIEAEKFIHHMERHY